MATNFRDNKYKNVSGESKKPSFYNSSKFYRMKKERWTQR